MNPECIRQPLCGTRYHRHSEAQRPARMKGREKRKRKAYRQEMVGGIEEIWSWICTYSGGNGNGLRFSRGSADSFAFQAITTRSPMASGIPERVPAGSSSTDAARW